MPASTKPRTRPTTRSENRSKRVRSSATKPVRRTAAKPGKAPRRTGAAATRKFPSLRRGDGCGAVLHVAERSGGTWDQGVGTCEISLSAGRRPAGRSPRISPRTCRALAAFSHPARARLMLKMLEGPATYRALQKATKLKAGPLYHHVNQLRLGGLILPKERDLYELTRGGRNLVLAVIVAEPLIADARRRLPSG